MEETKKKLKLKSFDFAESTSKQLITLSTAIVAFTITFGKELFGNAIDKSTLIVLIISWILFVFSIVCGIWTLMALTGSLDKTIKVVKEDTKEKEELVSIYDSNIRIPEGLQMMTFVLALIVTIVYAIMLSRSEPLPVNNCVRQHQEIRIIRQSSYTVQDSIRIDTLGVEIPEIH